MTTTEKETSLLAEMVLNDSVLRIPKMRRRVEERYTRVLTATDATKESIEASLVNLVRDVLAESYPDVDPKILALVFEIGVGTCVTAGVRYGLLKMDDIGPLAYSCGISAEDAHEKETEVIQEITSVSAMLLANAVHTMTDALTDAVEESKKAVLKETEAVLSNPSADDFLKAMAAAIEDAVRSGEDSVVRLHFNPAEKDGDEDAR